MMKQSSSGTSTYNLGHIFCIFISLMLIIASSEANNVGAGASSGDFIIKDGVGNSTQALILSSKVDLEINGLVTDTRLQQRFYNSSHDFVAGEYVFPLPDSASVNSLTIKIGSRIIRGEIKEKQQAKKIFKKAQVEGKKAALLIQDRPNLFRMAVTNIPPGEIIEINMTYVNPVELDQGEYKIMFPMTLTPRYNTKSTEVEENLNSNNLSNNSFQNPNFKLNHPAGADIENPIEISVRLNPGFTTKEINSSSHDVSITDNEALVKNITFTKRFVPMDSDFHLSWKQDNKKTQSQLFIESVDSKIDEQLEVENGEHYAMLMVTPTADSYEQKVLNKEVIFIIDTSGSMGGDSIRQAKKALSTAVNLLNEGDSFNVIEFNSDYSKLFEQSENFNSSNEEKAKNYIEDLKAGGGTEMKPALLQALKSPIDKEERLRQVVFITDGAVGNEQELIRTINQFLGDSRLFSIAIGSAPNQHLFRQVSKIGKGTFIQINQISQVNSKMKNMFKKISKPALKNIELIDHDGTVLAIEPESIPDVYFGEPIKLALKLSRPDSNLSIKGTLAGKAFEQALSITSTNSKGIAKLWGKAKIEALMDKMTLGQGHKAQLKQEIIDLSIKHNILTSFTSFIAVDKVVSRESGQPLQQSNVDNILPKGTSFPTTALDIQPLYAISLLFSVLGLLFGFRRKAL